MKVNILLLRHGKVNGPAALYGHTNVLVEQNLDDQTTSALASKTLHLSKIVSSPLSRCSNLAKQLSCGLGITLNINPDLAEMNFGRFDGVAFDSMSSGDWQQLAPFWDRPAECALQGGERLADFHQRVVSAWREVLETEQNTLVICHGGVIRQILADVLGLDWRNPKLYSSLAIGNSTITQIQFDTDYPENLVVKVIGQPAQDFNLVP